MADNDRPQSMPDEARLTDEEIDIAWGDGDQADRNVADAATKKTWHSRDAEVAELQAQLEVQRVGVLDLMSVAEDLQFQRDAALEDARRWWRRWRHS